MSTNSVRRVAVLGNHLPRQCGIATFTTDLSSAIVTGYPAIDCFVLAMNEGSAKYAYPPSVRFEIPQNEVAAYRRAADFLNVNTVDVVSLQHEYGIFGGRAGAHVLTLLGELRMPVVTTLHTILATPDPQQRLVMNELTRLSERLVVMSAQGGELLQQVYDVPESKIDLIPHGVPSVPPAGASKDRLGVEGKAVLLTFGLLSPDKGIEYVIDALPKILSQFPDAVYIILGATHPHLREHHGESYRVMLETRALKLGVDANVIFHNRFVSHAELTEFLAAADIYITPSLQPEQTTSGTLAYAVGTGRAVISTPYVYARELLADGRGVLVPWRDADAIAQAVNHLLADEKERLAMGRRAAAHGRDMTWPAVARGYLESFERARVDHSARLRTTFQAKTLAERPAGLPELNLAHLRLMTDDTGLMQHAIYNVPRYDDGYCLDDNARGLLLLTLVEEAGTNEAPAVRAAAARYLAFVNHAFNLRTGRFRNFMSYERCWTEQIGSEDSHGRAIWSLGTVVGHLGDPGRRSLAADLFHAALPAVPAFSSPRAWAYTLLGIDEYLGAFQGDRGVQSVRAVLADRLLDLFQRTSGPNWPWFENRVTYCNGRLPQALLVSGARIGDPRMVSAGNKALEWLVTIQRSPDGYFAPVGSDTGVERGVPAVAFDHQPVEACVMVSACLDALRVTGDDKWTEHARHAFSWFLGQNHLQCSLYDASTGGCRDGLHADRPNENQGAESTLSFMLALVDMRSIDPGTILPPISRDRTL
ncbi:MAG: glycosyltransferase family 4 protein [Gemmatimonadota bacterium]|nr:glycosyltransferase family 4 protein [Gemmatimonadota bacterium]